jgi:hypothetical protein
MMKVMVIVKASEQSEAGMPPDTELIRKMSQFNEELMKADILVAADGLKPSSEGKRVRFSGEQRIVIDGPFAETKELIAGFWIWNVKSMDEAVKWLKRAPFDGSDAEVEIRPYHSLDDFDTLTPELKARNRKLREQLSAKS